MEPVRVSVPPLLPPYPISSILPVRPPAPPLPPYPTSTTLPVRLCPADDWPVIFQDLVARQQDRIRRARERYQLSEQFLFPEEREKVQADLTDLQSGLDRYTRLVLQEQSYIDFGSGKVTRIEGPHGRSDAIIALINSIDRLANDVEKFLISVSTPEAVQEKCRNLPKNQCKAPCLLQKHTFRADRCTF